MTLEKHSFVATLPNDKEVSFELYPDRRDGKVRTAELERAIRAAMQTAGITTPRKHPQAVSVKVQRLAIEKGKLVRRPAAHFSIMPYTAPITDAEFNEESESLLSELPEEFRGCVEQRAYEIGHAYGSEEVLSHTRSLVELLKTPIQAYAARLQKPPT